nr:HAD hydrolase-like protein [Kibdelosporangium sp. MJ126-NF4]CEL17456.1 Haloacid dehalogenase-like hydrolase [Kibdelosporangium sp. MJ126-NF4]CTQ91317.1 Haloacid dehalogenase-like hydrolase [Kibdelosporangium sp. MJ126-NF4]
MSLSSVPRVLVLFDVDHTLIETRGVGREMYERIFPVVIGVPFRKLAAVSGRTELDIIRETLELHGIDPTGEAVSRLAASLVKGYEAARDELAERGRVLPGARESLERLGADDGIYLGVLTGNLRGVARIKLEVFGLDGYLDLEASAYGDDDPQRSELVAIAQRRATEQTSVVFDDRCTVLIGDTPKDVEAALTAGVRVIGVASGKSSMDDLRAAGATQVLADLVDPVAVVRAVVEA